MIGPIGATQRADAFILEISDGGAKMLYPAQWGSSMHLIVKNKTLLKLVGKIETGGQKVLQYFTIDSRANYSVPLPSPGRNGLFFVSMIPPLQKMELKAGGPPRAIPPRID